MATVGLRRVAGLRRSEVASLAGMSVEYYAKLERGALGGVSPGILDVLARALRLDGAEPTHLLHLACAADGSSAVLRPASPAESSGARERSATTTASCASCASVASTTTPTSTSTWSRAQFRTRPARCAYGCRRGQASAATRGAAGARTIGRHVVSSRHRLGVVSSPWWPGCWRRGAGPCPGTRRLAGPRLGQRTCRAGR